MELNPRANTPSALVEVVISFHGSLETEIASLIQACRGDHPDRFGRLNYWKCMLVLIPFILTEDILMANVNEIAKTIVFSKDQVVRSLNRFVLKDILIKSGSGSYTFWKLNDKSFPLLYFICRKKSLTHIMRHWLTYNAIENISPSDTT